MTDPQERQGVEAMNAFFNQFGPLDDVYVNIFWQVLLEELYGIDYNVAGGISNETSASQRAVFDRRVYSEEKEHQED